MKKGDKITMMFTGAGVTSTEEHTVLSFDEKTVTLDADVRPDGKDDIEKAVFHRKTGRCLNDNTAFAFYRHIQPCP